MADEAASDDGGGFLDAVATVFGIAESGADTYANVRSRLRGPENTVTVVEGAAEAKPPAVEAPPMPAPEPAPGLVDYVVKYRTQILVGSLVLLSVALLMRGKG